MTRRLNSFEAIASALEPVEDVLFGVRLEAATVGAMPEQGVELSLSHTGLFLLRDDLASFRMQLSVETGLFIEASIDVASNFRFAEGLSFAREPFFEFANAVAGPHVRAYAQVILDGLLSQMKLPPKLLPPMSIFDGPAFKGEDFPDVLDSQVFDRLRKTSNE